MNKTTVSLPKPIMSHSEVKEELLRYSATSRSMFHPLVLFAALVLFSVLIFIADTLFFFLVSLCLLLCLLIITKTNREEFKARNRGFWSILLFIFVMHLLFSRPSGCFLFVLPSGFPLIGNIGVIDIWGVREGMVVGLRLLLLYWSALLFTLNISSEQFILSLRNAGLPFEVAFVFDLAIRLLPRVQQSFYDLKMVQQAKGIRPGRNVIKNLRSMSKLLLPLIISQILHAKELSIAMYSRGFRPGTPRSSFFTLRMALKDYLLLGVVLLLFVLSLLFLRLPESVLPDSAWASLFYL